MNHIKKLIKHNFPAFFWSIYFLPYAQKNALYTFFAFFYHLNKLIDNASPADYKDFVTAWKDEINNIYNTKAPATEIGRQIYKNCLRFQLPREQLMAIIDSLMMLSTNKILSYKQLETYCKGIYGSANNFLLRIVGVKDQEVLESLSNQLGMSLQITKILRKNKEDALSNKTYIPLEFLQEAGINTENSTEILHNNKLEFARSKLASIAKENFEEAQKNISKLNIMQQRIIKPIYLYHKNIFDIMDKRGWQIISPEPRISFIKSLYIISHIFKK